jgi:L-proline 4-hydroxylase
MLLTPHQLAEFDNNGYLFFPNAFSQEETNVLKKAAVEVYAMQREEVWRESSGVTRTAFAAHTYNDAFRRLGAHPRLINPVACLGYYLSKLGDP